MNFNKVQNLHLRSDFQKMPTCHKKSTGVFRDKDHTITKSFITNVQYDLFLVNTFYHLSDQRYSEGETNRPFASLLGKAKVI